MKKLLTLFLLVSTLAAAGVKTNYFNASPMVVSNLLVQSGITLGGSNITAWSQIGGAAGTTDHSVLSNLLWTASGHTGTPARLAGFFEGGAAGYAGFGAGLYLDGSDNITISNAVLIGAAAGATAVQPAAIAGMLTNNCVAPSFNNSIYIGLTNGFTGWPTINMLDSANNTTNSIRSSDQAFNFFVGTNEVMEVTTSSLHILGGSSFVGPGTGLTGTGTTFTAGNALAANYSTSSGIASNLTSGSATTGQVATANGSGGTFWSTPAAGGATSGWTNLASVVVTNSISTGGTIALPSGIKMLRIFGAYANTNTVASANAFLFMRFNNDSSNIYDQRGEYLGGTVANANQTSITLSDVYGTRDNAARGSQFFATVSVNQGLYPSVVTSYGYPDQNQTPPMGLVSLNEMYRSTATVTSIVWGVLTGAATNTLFYIEGYISP
jgi:hypothetical protein